MLRDINQIKDSCPVWADELIFSLKQIEIYLGNIPEALAWESSHVEKIAKRAFQKQEAVFNEEKADLVFRKIVKGLASEGYSVETMEQFVNARIGYKGGPPYCNHIDISDALSHSHH